MGRRWDTLRPGLTSFLGGNPATLFYLVCAVHIHLPCVYGICTFQTTMWSGVNIQVWTATVCLMKVNDPQCWSDSHIICVSNFVYSPSFSTNKTWRLFSLWHLSVLVHSECLLLRSLASTCWSTLSWIIIFICSLCVIPSPVLSLQSFLWVCVVLSLYLSVSPPPSLSFSTSCFPFSFTLNVTLQSVEICLCLYHMIPELVLDHIHHETCWVWCSVDTGYKAERVEPVKYRDRFYTVRLRVCLCAQLHMHALPLWPQCGDVSERQTDRAAAVCLSLGCMKLLRDGDGKPKLIGASESEE